MSTNELITLTAITANVPRKTCQKVVNAFLQEIKENLKIEERIIIGGYMTLDVVKRDARRGRNPKTGVVEDFPPNKVVRCRLSDQLKRVVKEDQRNEEQEF